MFLFSKKWTRLFGDGKKRDVLDRDILYKIIRILNQSKFDMYWKLHYFVGEFFA
jgi:mRNA-degrading endonuclease YafQ of YafQ-DinJ toxin-antitoxin module